MPARTVLPPRRRRSAAWWCPTHTYTTASPLQRLTIRGVGSTSRSRPTGLCAGCGHWRSLRWAKQEGLGWVGQGDSQGARMPMTQLPSHGCGVTCCVLMGSSALTCPPSPAQLDVIRLSAQPALCLPATLHVVKASGLGGSRGAQEGPHNSRGHSGRGKGARCE